MAVVIKGLAETRSAMRKFEPDLLKASDKEMRRVLVGITNAAKGFVPVTSPLSGWGKGNGSFPAFKSSAIRAGLRPRIGRAKKTRSGFTAIYAIQNKSAAGAIYETAGRINPSGQPWGGRHASKNDHKVSHSNNPDAGRDFVEKIDRQSNYRKPRGKKDGRLAFRAVEENNGKAVRAIEQAVLKSQRQFAARTRARVAFGGEQ